MKVLFVCLGNICRSPAAEGIFSKMLETQGLKEHILCDSAGTGGWHAGEPPDGRMIEHAKNRGYNLSPLRARQFQPGSDFEKFDLIVTMDQSNFEDVCDHTDKEEWLLKVRPITDYCKIHQVDHVPDPYHRRADGFELVLDILEDACSELLNDLSRTIKT